MKRTLALFALASMALAIPAQAATSFVQDGASMFSASTVSQLNERIGTLQAQTGKEIVVVTVPSLNGEQLASAAQTVFNDQHVNGLLIFIAKDDRKDIIDAGTATSQFFPTATIVDIRTTMESQFKSGDFDGGITGAVSSALDIFNAHANSARNNASNGGISAVPRSTRHVVRTSNGGFHLNMFWWIVLIFIGFMVLRSIMRSASGPRYYGGSPMGGPGYGGYGPGYGGGGGFWSGLLGGLGGAWLGNEMFGNRGGTTIIDDGSGTYQQQDQGGGWGGNSGDSGGWGQDSGVGNSSGGDFSGGGFGDSGGGGFDGGGGGDSGGGW